MTIFNSSELITLLVSLFRVSDAKGSLEFTHIKGGSVKKGDFDRNASSLLHRILAKVNRQLFPSRSNKI